jgi:hypothetical protein
MASPTTIRLPPKLRGLVKDALAADRDIEKTGEVYRAEHVHAWMKRLAVDDAAPRPAPLRK